MNRKLKFGFLLLIACVLLESRAQELVLISGKVVDRKTDQPLINASIGMKGLSFGTISDADGHFELSIPNEFLNDTLFISYVGYRTFKKKLSQIVTKNVFSLDEVSTLLDEVTILEKRLYKFEVKKLESSMKLVKGDLFSAKAEVTNEEYNQFLNYLVRSGQKSLYEKYKPDISGHKEPLLTFFKGYHIPYELSTETKYNSIYDDYPVVNISYEAALAYCSWLTDQYNKSEKKKFDQVKFRLPTLKEWRIAALGYKNFQSWEFEENEVEVGIPETPGDMIASKTRIIPVKGNNILYPWYGAHDYKDKAQNNKNCWMGNFKVPPESVSCFIDKPGGDGFLITGKVASYFPNGMGLYDVVGNVAEMIVDKGLACGGSWNHSPEESTMTSVYKYAGADGAVGFRIFMESASGDFNGKYEMTSNPARVALIRNDKGKLILEVVNEFKSELSPQTETVYKVKSVKPHATLEFIKDETGNVTKFVVSQNGLFEWRKLNDQDAGKKINE